MQIVIPASAVAHRQMKAPLKLLFHIIRVRPIPNVMTKALYLQMHNGAPKAPTIGIYPYPLSTYRDHAAVHQRIRL